MPPFIRLATSHAVPLCAFEVNLPLTATLYNGESANNDQGLTLHQDDEVREVMSLLQ